MRVAVSTVEDFIEDLEKDGHESVVQAVRWQVDREAMQPEEITWSVGIRATAVKRLEDGGEYLLELYQGMGKADDAEAAEFEKTAERAITDACYRLGIETRKGVISA